MSDTHSVPVILDQARLLIGMSRYVFLRDVFDEYIKIPFQDYTGVHKSQLLELLFENDTLIDCASDCDYRKFVIAVTRHFMAPDEIKRYGIGSDIEGCLWALSQYPVGQQSEEFCRFCGEFADALSPYILSADDHFKMAHIVLPLSTRFSDPEALGPGMSVIRETIAQTLCQRHSLYDAAHLVGVSTGTIRITDFAAFLRSIRKVDVDDDFFRIAIGAYIIENPSYMCTKSVLEEVLEVEELTRPDRTSAP